MSSLGNLARSQRDHRRPLRSVEGEYRSPLPTDELNALQHVPPNSQDTRHPDAEH